MNPSVPAKSHARIRRILLPALLLSLALVTTGCGTAASDKVSELQNYQDQMETFFDDVENYNRQLSSLDPASEQTAAASAPFSASVAPDSSAASTDSTEDSNASKQKDSDEDLSVSSSKSSDVSSASSEEDSAEEGSAESLSLDLSETEAQFLTLIDKLAGSCRTAARLHVPADYTPAGSLCQKANDAMQEAKVNYHSAFESSTFNEADFNAAQDDYMTAVETIHAMTQYFQTYGEESAEASTGASS